MKINFSNQVSYWIAFCLIAWIGAPVVAYQDENRERVQPESAANAASDEKPVAQASTQFLRLHTDEFKDPEALQTATVWYAKKDERGRVQFEVVLESVIHVADTSYFRAFQKRFERYDQVLYESMIRQEKKSVEAENVSSGFKMLQQLSTGTLGLAYQFDEIDYGPRNFIHADLAPEDIVKRMESIDDAGTVLMADLIGHIIKQFKQEQPDENAISGAETFTNLRPSELVSALTDPNGIMKIRRAMATALVGSGLLESPLPPMIHKLLIGDRNEQAMTILKRELDGGAKRIAMFYGVGNMADLEHRLVNDLGMERVSVNWRNAWDLRDGAVEGAPLEGLIESTFRDSFKEKLRGFARGLRSGDSDKGEDAAKDQQLEEMEKSLEALKARLRELEQMEKGSSGGGDG